MMRNLLGVWTHFRVRLIWTLRDPAALGVLLLFSMATLLYWPGPDPLTMDLEMEMELVAWLLWAMWLYMWPALPAIYAAGRATGGRGTALRHQALPTLPVGARARAVAEVLLVLVWLTAVRSSASLVYPGLEARSVAISTLIGALAMLPPLISWAAPARSLNGYMLRPLVAVVLFASAGRLGFTVTLPGLAATSLLVVVLVLFIAGREWSLPALHRSVPKAEERVRLGIDPERRLRRDAWWLVLETWGTPAALLVAALVFVFALDVRGSAPPYALVGVFGVLLGFAVSLTLRPFDSKLIALGLGGRHGVRMGDFARAWSVLPVRREAVLRRVYLHGLLVLGSVWLGTVASVVIRSWALFGQPALRATDGGDLSILLLPFGATVPCLAGMLTAAAVGDRVRTVISGAAFLLVFYGHILLLASLTAFFDRGSNIPRLIDIAFVVLIALIGGIPPLVHLRRPHDVAGRS
jgi:hypothetical protein